MAINKGWLLALCLVCPAAFGMTLQEARERGLIGETFSGYLAVRVQNQETQSLVEQINKSRADNYQALADSNNVPVDEVARLAGAKLVARAKPGEYVRGVNGQWMKKP